MNDIKEEAQKLFLQDPMQHLVSLKYLSYYWENAEVELSIKGDHWASAVKFPTEISGWDKKFLPQTKQVILLEGNDARQVEIICSGISGEGIVIKINKIFENIMKKNKPEMKVVNKFISYTTGQPLEYNISGVEAHSQFENEVIALLLPSGYSESELERHISKGANWFGIRKEGRIISACLIYQNFEDIWEIGGVYTIPEFRQKGFARAVVITAVNEILKCGRIPRYQVDGNNLASNKLAVSIGLKEFLCIHHYL